MTALAAEVPEVTAPVVALAEVVPVVVQALNPEAQLLPQNPIPDQIHKTLTPGFMPGL